MFLNPHSTREIFERTYQYLNFEIPGLGLKRGLSENIVVAPYATALASWLIQKRRAEFQTPFSGRRSRPLRLV